MANAFTFQVKGLDKLLGLFEQLPGEVKKELGAELEFAADEVKDRAKADAPADEARLRNSISVQKIDETTFNVTAQTFYAGYLEFGTKTYTSIPAGLEDIAGSLQGPVSGQGNPIDALTDWVGRKQIAGTYSVKTRKRAGSKETQQQQNKQLAFIIWRKIKKYGIKPHPYFFKQMPIVEPKLRERVANIISKII